MLPNKFKDKVQLIIGSFKNINNGPYEILDNTIIDFFNNVSKEIFNNKETKNYVDVASFGFWCRFGNIRKLVQEYKKSCKNRIGRGTILHITPSNVPTNFVYSLAFGLLAGNHNIVRLPSKNFFQVEIICNIFKKLLKKKKFKEIRNRITLIKYVNSDEISMQLSKVVEGRVIWGGDGTIRKFKNFETSPRCIDLTFADRFSVSLINSNKLFNLSNNKIKILANQFYNDTYTMDQFGCSSPTILLWIGKKEIAKEKFWLELQKIVDKKYLNDLSSANKKISNLTHFTLSKKKKFNINYHKFNLIRLKNIDDNLDHIHNINFGTFCEMNLKNLNSINMFSSNKLQTITYYGFNFNDLKQTVVKNKIKGIDRIVPIGRAFDLTPEWDGIDIVLTLSRIIGS